MKSLNSVNLFEYKDVTFSLIISSARHRISQVPVYLVIMTCVTPSKTPPGYINPSLSTSVEKLSSTIVQALLFCYMPHLVASLIHHTHQVCNFLHSQVKSEHQLQPYVQQLVDLPLGL